MTVPVDIVGVKAFGTAELEQHLRQLGEPAYRARQIVHWLYQRGVGSYAEMTDLPAALRAKLARELPLTPSEIVETHVSADGTRKYLIQLGGKTTVEAVGLPDGDRLTVCFSTQAGCAMGCAFCATGQSGLERDLGPGEMVDQVRLVGSDFGQCVTNAVAMGQGEPFANYDATLAGLRLLNSLDGLGIGARHITVSTCGLIAGIRSLSHEPEQFTLAVSLHSAVQETRNRLMPGVRGVPLTELREAIAEYSERSGRRPTLEFALVQDVNDSAEELTALRDFCRGMLAHVNVIPVNPVAGSALARSAKSREFVAALQAAGIEATVRTERGSDIDAACGQLRGRRGKSS
jgi:23S rRNA (adenine2503-C2)-methyltransferase